MYLDHLYLFEKAIQMSQDIFLIHTSAFIEKLDDLHPLSKTVGVDPRQLFCPHCSVFSTNNQKDQIGIIGQFLRTFDSGTDNSSSNVASEN